MKELWLFVLLCLNCVGSEGRTGSTLVRSPGVEAASSRRHHGESCDVASWRSHHGVSCDVRYCPEYA